MHIVTSKTQKQAKIIKVVLAAGTNESGTFSLHIITTINNTTLGCSYSIHKLYL